MDKQKFVGRVNNMIYSICGCNLKEGIEVLEECLKLSKNCKKFPKSIFKRPNINKTDLVEYWADYVRTHSDKEWSKLQKVVINEELRKMRKNE